MPRSGGGPELLSPKELVVMPALHAIRTPVRPQETAQKVAQAILAILGLIYLVGGGRLIVDGQHEVRLEGRSLVYRHRRDCYPVTECGI